MSYEQHPLCATPPDDTVLWRYTSFLQFIDLVENKRLWFSRLDRLEDPREGCLTDQERQELRDATTTKPEIGEQHLRAIETLRLQNFVNCWTENAESMAMWNLYAESTGGLAVKSTVGRLKRAVSDTEYRIFIAKVDYLDWATAPWSNNVIGRYVRKIRAFDHEKEVRLLIWHPGDGFLEGALSDGVKRIHDLVRTKPEFTGRERSEWNRLYQIERQRVSVERALSHIEVLVEPSEVIEEIIVTPKSAAWRRLVTKVLNERYGLPEEIVRQSLLT